MEAVTSDIDERAGSCKFRTPTCGRRPLIEEAEARERDEKPNDAHMLIVDPDAPLRNLMSKGNEGARPPRPVGRSTGRPKAEVRASGCEAWR
jgi:hypothetical protein